MQKGKICQFQILYPKWANTHHIWRYALKGREFWSVMEGLCIPMYWGHLWVNVKCIGLWNFHRNHSTSSSLCCSAADRYNAHVYVWGGGWYGEKKILPPSDTELSKVRAIFYSFQCCPNGILLLLKNK